MNTDEKIIWPDFVYRQEGNYNHFITYLKDGRVIRLSINHHTKDKAISEYVNDFSLFKWQASNPDFVFK